MNQYSLDLQEITKSFIANSGEVREVLKGTSLSIISGKITGLIGSNGAGKSTLLSIISGRLLPDGGSVLLDGKHIRGLSQEQRARWIGVVEQDTYKTLAAGLTVGELLALASRRQERLGLRKLRIAKALAAVKEHSEDVGKFLASRSESASRELSGGQRQLLALAVAILGRPKILLLDEHLASLDSDFIRAADELLESMVEKQNIAVLAVAHDRRWVRQKCSPIFSLREGRAFQTEPEHIGEINASD